MTDEVKKQENDEEKDESKEEKEDKEKSQFGSSLDALTETIKNFDINGLKDEIKNVGATVDGFDARLKALETPTDLPLKPKVSADEDIGAKVKAPDTYQSNSSQAGIKEADPENGQASDKNSLSMQEKSLSQAEQVFTTETPRPGAALETVEKSYGRQVSEVLKAARTEGYEGLSNVGRRILKGDFGAPEDSEVPQW
jgi:hypothetical protein